VDIGAIHMPLGTSTQQKPNHCFSKQQ